MSVAQEKGQERIKHERIQILKTHVKVETRNIFNQKKLLGV
jgi:hypothetical protein